jgi:hypothetical protein
MQNLLNARSYERSNRRLCALIRGYLQLRVILLQGIDSCQVVVAVIGLITGQQHGHGM